MSSATKTIVIPIAIRIRSLSEQFDASSPSTQDNVLGYTGGVKPTSKYKELLKLRADSLDGVYSPVTKSLLVFYGIRKTVN